MELLAGFIAFALLGGLVLRRTPETDRLNLESFDFDAAKSREKVVS